MFPEIHTKGELGSEPRVALFHFSTFQASTSMSTALLTTKKIKAVVEDLGQGLRCVILTLAAEVP